MTFAPDLIAGELLSYFYAFTAYINAGGIKQSDCPFAPVRL